ncbi:MAG: exodeoxyribonuclease V subunit beta, partial [Deltaproteobacteria bacterium]|nr:exodeoxyribonuclease V subunit beta [Deltaproteobacteria bacterium]
KRPETSAFAGVENILVVTYTEAATAELRVRILEKIRLVLKGLQLIKQSLKPSGNLAEDQLKDILKQLEDGFVSDLFTDHFQDSANKDITILENAISQLKLAILSFDEAAIYTIHGFCKKMLTDYSLEAQAGFDFNFITNQNFLIDECVNDFWRTQVYQSNKSNAEFFLSFFETPAEITEYLNPIINKPYTLFKPAAEGLFKNFFASVRKHYQKLGEEWQMKRTEIMELIESNADCFLKPYRISIPLMSQELDHYFSKGIPTDVAGVVVNFSQSIIDSNKMQKKKCQELDLSHSFFKSFEDYSSIKEKLVANIIPSLVIDFIHRKAEANILSFDDLLQNLHKSIKQTGGDELKQNIRKRFQVAMIDEFQDTDPIQYEIFHDLFFNHIPLFFIGDPKQSIYNFRGADIFAYFKAVKDANSISHLKTNWRSCTDLVKAFNTIFTGLDGENSQFIYRDKIKYSESKGAPNKPERLLVIEDQEPAPFHLWFQDDPDITSAPKTRELIANATVGEITRLLNLGAQKKAFIKSIDPSNPPTPIEPKDIAILVSAHKDADLFQQALRLKNIPSVQKGTQNIFETKEFAEIKLLLKGVLEYHNESILRPVFVTEIFDLNGETILNLNQDEQKWEEIVDTFRVLNQIWQHKGLASMLQYFMGKENLRERFLKYDDGERKLSNFIQISEILMRTQTENQIDNSGLIQWMDQIQQSPDDYPENEIRLETDDKAVSILTIHASKGLQFPIVFCPFGWSEGKKDGKVMYHDSRNDDQLTWDLLKSENNQKKSAQEKLAERIRLAYVAFTRAKCCCYTTWWKSSYYKGSSYSYLFNRKIFNCSSKEFKSISIEDYLDELNQFQDLSDGSIEVAALPPGTDELYIPPKNETEVLVCQTLDKQLYSNSRTYSFTGLTHQQPYFQTESKPGEKDVGEVDSDEPNALDTANNGLVNFPGGITTGNFFHDILENTDFSSAEPPEAMVLEKLNLHGYDKGWLETVLQLIEDVRTLPLKSTYSLKKSFKFSAIPPNQIVKEMAFQYSINQVTLDKMIEVVKSAKQIPIHLALQTSLESIQYQELNGFMRGFIDMVFYHQGRYFILDWKTNNLGKNLEDYSPQNLQSKINEFQYNLQYFIYSIALHKYLKTRITDYKFDQHFGGVYYLFLRGIQSNNDQYGVYYESLAESQVVIETLGELFEGGQNV